MTPDTPQSPQLGPIAAGLADLRCLYRRHGLKELLRKLVGRIRTALYRTGFWFADEFGTDGDWGVRHPQWGTAFFTPEWLASKACPSRSTR